MISLSNSTTMQPWYRHRWPWLLMLGPALVVAAGSYTGWLAVSRQDALVVDDYYKQGNAINKDLRRDREAQRLLVASNLSFNPAAGRLQGRITSMGNAFTHDIAIKLVHPTQPAKDITLIARPDAQGLFTAALPMLDAGRWHVVIENERSDWRLTGIWNWPGEQAIALRADLVPVD
jgi:uncharacterized protein